MPLQHQVAPVRFLEVPSRFQPRQPRSPRERSRKIHAIVGVGGIPWNVVSGVSPCLNLWTVIVMLASRGVKNMRQKTEAHDP